MTTADSETAGAAANAGVAANQAMASAATILRAVFMPAKFGERPSVPVDGAWLLAEKIEQGGVEERGILGGSAVRHTR